MNEDALIVARFTPGLNTSTHNLS